MEWCFGTLINLTIFSLFQLVMDSMELRSDMPSLLQRLRKEESDPNPTSGLFNSVRAGIDTWHLDNIMFPGGGLAIVEGKRGLGTAHLPFVFFLIAPSVLMGACATSFPRTWNTKLYNYSLKCYYVSWLRRYHSKRYETQISIFITCMGCSFDEIQRFRTNNWRYSFDDYYTRIILKTHMKEYCYN